MKLLDGRSLAEKVYEELKPRIVGRSLSLGIILVGGDPVARRFTELKKETGVSLGIDVRVYSFSQTETTRSLRKKIAGLVKETGHDGFIIQLPLPEGLNTQYILNAIPEAKDVDALNQKSVGAAAVGRASIIPPVVAAVKTLLDAAGIELEGKKIVVIGGGRLVGRPIALWLTAMNLPFTLLTEQSSNLENEVAQADVLISGAGQPGLITAPMIKDGAVVIDAGTSSEGGELRGDVAKEGLENKNVTLAPVPGGVGPLTIAYIFQNLATLSE